MPVLKERMHSRGESFNPGAKLGVELDRLPPLGLSIEYCPLGDRCLEHLFQANRLRTELDAIGPLAVLVPRTLIFDRVGLPKAMATRHVNSELARVAREELDNIRHARKPQAKRVERQSATNERAGTRLDCPRMGALMEHLTLDRIQILLPLAFDVNEGPAPLAEREVL